MSCCKGLRIHKNSGRQCLQIGGGLKRSETVRKLRSLYRLNEKQWAPLRPVLRRQMTLLIQWHIGSPLDLRAPSPVGAWVCPRSVRPANHAKPGDGRTRLLDVFGRPVRDGAAGKGGSRVDV
jgi:hypothetical protein